MKQDPETGSIWNLWSNEMIAQIGNEFNKADSQSLPSREEMHRPLRPRAASPRDMLESI